MRLFILWTLIFSASALNAQGPPPTTTLRVRVMSDGRRVVTVYRNDQEIKTFDEATDWVLGEKLSLTLQMLEQHNPHCFEIAQNLQHKAVFQLMLSFDDEVHIESLSTACHEAAHLLNLENTTRSRHAYFLLSGRFTYLDTGPAPPINSILTYLGPDQVEYYARTYLQGHYGTQGPESLLEELNAYALDANSVLGLAEGLKNSWDINPGLTRMMFFTQIYIYHVLIERPEHEQYFRGDNFKETLLTLWRQVESVLNRVCDSSYAKLSKNTIRSLYSSENLQAMKSLFPNESFVPPEHCQ